MSLWVFLFVAAIVALGFLMYTNKKKAELQLADTRETARQLHERLGGQTMNLTAPGDNVAAGQALADAGERYTAAGGQIARANTVPQYRLAAQSAVEGLHYVRAARESMGLEPGPVVPDITGAFNTGRLKEEISAEVEGQRVSASPQATEENTHYYPGGRVEGRPVPAGWYSTPWWKPAMAGVAGSMVGMMVFSALMVPAYASGAVVDPAPDAGSDGTGSDSGADSGDSSGDTGADAGADTGGGFDGGGFDF